MKTPYRFAAALLLLLNGCGDQKTESDNLHSFAADVAFLKMYQKNVIVLGGNSSAKVLLVGDFQARVMTSSAEGDTAEGYGYINYDLIQSREKRKHMNAYRGEDRFWLGPEGGQYGLYFSKDTPFDYEHWQVPELIDTEPFELISADSLQATYGKTGKVSNYKGTAFSISINRNIALLKSIDIEHALGLSLQNIHCVAYRSTNTVTNVGKEPWTMKDGLISIWVLGMLKPSSSTTIILPFAAKGKGKITDDYFGVIPPDRIKQTDSVLLMKGDALHRGKVGISPGMARNLAGSYDAERNVLTIIKFDLEESGRYLNSKWENQLNPYDGDAVNAYNDGPVQNGSGPGSFYELESSSPGLALEAGASYTHRHTTIHFRGDAQQLDGIAKKILGVGISDLRF